MIDLSSSNLYEILDVDPRATVAEIKRAYKIALSAYGTDHMATQGLFSATEKDAILNRIQEAYSVLMDPQRRRDYDEELRDKGRYPQRQAPDDAFSGVETKPPPRAETAESHPIEDPSVQEEKNRQVDEILMEADAREEYPGAILRQIREIRGFSLDDIAQRTKISRGHLRGLEEDSYDFLPPDTYLKGFLTQIATVLGVDPDLIQPRLMEYIRRARGPR
jgi:curved DNA-binding protein CbpA